jgi:hypothetical protein
VQGRFATNLEASLALRAFMDTTLQFARSAQLASEWIISREFEKTIGIFGLHC